MNDLLIGARLATHQLARMLGIPERQVEDHLEHVVKSIAHDKTRRFILEPSRCQDCEFVFRDRRRLTRPGRCPQCHSEDIAAPRYGIDLVGPPAGQKDSRTTTQEGAIRKDYDDRDTLPALYPVLQSSAGMQRRPRQGIAGNR